MGQGALHQGYLQHGSGASGPFRTELVTLRHEGADRYSVRFEGRWRKLHIQVKRLYIWYLGRKISVLFDGV